MWEMLRLAWIGMRLRCPACGQGRIFRNLTVMHESCPHCGAVFEREEGDFVGAIVVAYSITAVLVAIGIYVVEVFGHLDAMVHVILWSAFTVVFVVLTYRNMKGIWLGILHAMVGLRPRESARKP
jgi:uncharacterized protein (DUF983 family)